jgi:hypothetical protein
MLRKKGDEAALSAAMCGSFCDRNNELKIVSQKMQKEF